MYRVSMGGSERSKSPCSLRVYHSLRIQCAHQSRSPGKCSPFKCIIIYFMFSLVIFWIIFLNQNHHYLPYILTIHSFNLYTILRGSQYSLQVPEFQDCLRPNRKHMHLTLYALKCNFSCGDSVQGNYTFPPIWIRRSFFMLRTLHALVVIFLSG